MMKGVILVVMFLVGSATFGNSLECYKYFGNLEDFKNITELDRDNKTCIAGANEQCFKLVVNDEGTVLVTLGCARKEDNTAAKKTCAQVMKDNEKDEMTTTCETDWCNNMDKCNKPPYNVQCYSCFSTTSMKDCKDMSKPMFCGNSDDRCYKLSSMVTHDETEPSTKIMRYAKGCYSNKQCTEKDRNVFCTDDDCELNCCDGKMCNAGSFPAASALTLLACVVVYAFRL